MFFHIYITALKTKDDLHFFNLAWGAGKGSDRFYAWVDALFHLKRKGFYLFFNLCTFKEVRCLTIYSSSFC
ncbi:hypothetical protein COL91_02720 [Bacillus pseudomycoides]|nr:hypothetical protein COO02_21960 [Bacillus pseudomycoides]PGA94083.1 hypothetical protein COL91_02720 [Bacillus pseudomycoides]PHF49498.1 hypothetical protein COF72_07420 [Bacillus pseudomycoides]